MPSQELVEDIALTSSLKVLITTYEEISVMRMQRIRDAVLQTRSFIDGLVEVFEDVSESRRTVREAALARKIKREKVEARMQKPLLMLITTRSRFSGPVVRKIFRAFLTQADREEADIVIAGKVGQELFAAARPGMDFTYVEMPESRLLAADLAPLVQHAAGRQNVHIFYGRFINLIDQVSAETNLSEVSFRSEAEARGHTRGRRTLRFLFEPSFGEVVDFFDTQILGSLVVQAAHESQLAVLGSRVTAMEDASQRVNDRLNELKKIDRLLLKTKQNREQRDLMAGMTLWR